MTRLRSICSFGVIDFYQNIISALVAEALASMQQSCIVFLVSSALTKIYKLEIEHRLSIHTLTTLQIVMPLRSD